MLWRTRTVAFDASGSDTCGGEGSTCETSDDIMITINLRLFQLFLPKETGETSYSARCFYFSHFFPLMGLTKVEAR